MQLNILFDTQSIGIKVFWSLFQALKNETGIELKNAGFFVTNKGITEQFAQEHPEFRTCNAVSECEILAEAEKLDAPDLDFLEQWEQKIGDSSLWHALICDRRFNFPTKAQYVQTYRSAYSHDFMLKVVQVALQKINAHFDTVKPHAVVCLNAVTVYDYLYYLIATYRKIPYLQLKLTRVKNYVSYYTNPLGLSPHIDNVISKYISEPGLLKSNDTLFNETTQFLAHARGDSLSYEGAISKSDPDAKKEHKVNEAGAVKAFEASKLNRILRLLSGTQPDKHYPSARDAFFYTRFIKPFRQKRIEKRFFQENNEHWQKQIGKHSYALYPLNTEPEVALLVYGRSYRNQIETVRNIASSLPVGWKLVVKEHPNAKGYRSRGFYEKLLEIPNVVLLGPRVSTNEVVNHASLIFVIFGTIGLEAVIKKKPVITLNKTPYGSFPQNMVRYVSEIPKLSFHIRDLLNNHQHDETALISYIAAHIEQSIPLNLFTGLLGKGGRNALNIDQTQEQQYAALAAYTVKRIKQELQQNAKMDLSRAG